MRQKHTIQKLMMLLAMVLWSSHSVWAVDYIYNIINNSGNVVMRVKSTKTKAYLPDRARTPFAQSYRYYKTLVEAQNDARYGEEVAEGSYGAHAFADNVAISTMGLTAGSDGKYQIYVRYDYEAHNTKVKDNNNQAVRIDGTRAYNFQISTRMVYYSTDTESYTTPPSSKGKTPTVTPKASEPIRVTATSNVSQVSEENRQLPNYKWLFIGTKAGFYGSLGQPDPYDIKIVNVEQYAQDKTKVLTAVNTQALPLTPTTNSYLHLSYSTDGAVATNVYRFFFRMIGTQVQVMAAKNLFVYNGENNNPAEGQWYVMNKEKDEPDYNDFHDETCFPSLHMREHGKHEGGNGGDRAVTLYYVRPTHQYVIVGSDGTQRAKAYAPVDDDNTLKVPASIATVVPVTYTYYASLANATAKTSALETLPAVSTAPVIYVRYDYNAGNNPLVKLDGSAKYTVVINDHYVKYDATGAYDSHVEPGSTQEAESGVEEYIWHTWGNDPYGIYVTNEKAGAGNYFTGTSTTGTIALGTNGVSAAVQKTDSYTGHTPGRYYLVASPQYTPSRPSFLFRSVYTGDDDFYTWGYFGTEKTTADDWDGLRPRLFKSSLVGDDNDALRMEIYELRDNNVTYHIIDKQGREVISAANKKVFLALPDEIYSPLVSTYHYYTLDQFNVSDGVYTLKSGATEITDRVTTGRNDIYVTYDAGMEIDINPVEYNTMEGTNYGKYTDTVSKDKKKYMIRFLNGQSYYQEDGKDGLTQAEYLHSNSYFHTDQGGPGPGTYKAEYVYVNGDGNLNIYCDFLREKQFGKAANERSRWSWFIIGDHGTGVIDPYHVTIQAGNNTSHTNKAHGDAAVNSNYYASLRTYYNTELRAVVTSTISNDSLVRLYNAKTWTKGSTAENGGSDDNVPTEYMILGQKGKYRLVTSQPIFDGTTTEHRTVNTFEQYWKNYDLIRKNYFKQDTIARRENTPLNSEQIAELEDRGWHRYKAWANAVPWDGCKSEGDKSKDKVYVYTEHWYQTFDVGEEFELVEVKPDPAIVLVDKHGWEVFRHPMPTTKAADSDKTKAIFIKSYDSPMVTYHWYKNSQKDTGCHRYTLSEPAMKEDGSGEYTSESLLEFPPHYGQHAGDWYVSYEVKADFKDLYYYDGTTGKSAPVLIQQNGDWATAASESAIGSVTGSTVTIDTTDPENVTITGGENITSSMLWYLVPSDLETEMGYPNNKDTLTLKNDQLCFDPYNVQIRSAANSKYFKTAATEAELKDAQHWLGKPPYNIGLGANTEATGWTNKTEGFDHTTVHITNATFMMIQDAHGHLRLCPRFDNESAVTNLTGGSPNVTAWIYDNKTENVSYDQTTQLYTITPNSTNDVTQAIKLYPLQRYQFHIRDLKKGGAADDVLTSNEFYAVAGTSLIHQLSNLTAPLPVEYIRAYCEYQGAYTNFDSSTNTYSGEVTSYPPGTENGIELTHIYVPYTVVSTAAFFDSEAEAVASNNWMFLLQGTESVATIFGKKLIDYGMEVRYGFRDAAQSEDIGVDMPDLTPAERSFVWNSGKYGGFHFLRRGGTPTVNVNTGAMTFDAGQETVLSTVGPRRIASKDSTASVYLLSPLNDFRRIAETYMEGRETSFRESSWLWAFIGTPYKFYAINREDALANAEGKRKRLAVAAKTSGKELLVLTDGYQTGEPYNPRQAGAYWFTMSKYAVQTDEEAANTFALQLWDGDNIESNDSCIGKGSNANEFVKAPKNLIKKGTTDQPDIAVMKVSSFRAYPWNWDDKKYQNVTVNIYPGTESSHGALALTKTYTRADRAFIAGDVLDGTDGHFYLRIEAQEDGSWKPNGIVENTMPYDHHLINIPYELRRKFCRYTVAGGSFTVQEVDDETPQVLNVYYTVDTEHAPLFIAESELADFRQYITAGKDAPYKDGKKYSDYFYFLDQNHQLTKHLYANDKKGYSEATRFSATNDPKQLMWYFVGDPYNVRLFNVYTDLNSEETRNFVRHRYADKMHSTGYSEDETNDNKTYMENVKNKVFYWEMVDTWAGVGKGELDSTHVNVSYRKDLLMGKSFALRMKMTGSADPAAVISDATYYYLRDNNAQTGGENIYNEESGGSLSPKMNTQTSFPTYPDNRHSANNSSATLTPLKPTKVKVTVFDPDEPNRKVTDDEVSDYFAVTDHFKGVPDNLQRKHCEYWWVSTDPDPKSTNMVDENLYFTVTDENPHIYVRYREDATSPFSTLVDGVPVLKRDASLNPWYNMNIGNWWAFFNSSLDGKTYLLPGTSANVFNNSTVSFVYKGNTLPNTTDKFHKGLQWALVGDPYNFTLRNGRDRMRTSSLDSERDPAYLNQTAISTEGTTWTWIRNGVKNTAGQYEYFLSESSGRRTEIAAKPSGANTLNAPRRILPSDYTISAQSETRNFTVTDGTGASSGTGISNIATGDNYAIGSNMFLTSVTSEGADNESFDAIVNVYNKMNELVATTGWTELARSNAEWNGSLPVDVRRWGCTYHYWADETMTRYPFHKYDQTDDGQPKSDTNNYLIKDGGTVYVTYDYDESLYSSENEYRWVNLFFNWDDEHKEWRNDAVTEKEYTAEFWEYNTASGEFEKRHEYDVNATQNRWVEHHLYTDTQEGWIESPKDNGTYDKNKAYAYWDQGQYTNNQDRINSQKWAMIGDPYKFILYNYHRKAEAGPKNAYYLRWTAQGSPLQGIEAGIRNYAYEKFPLGKENTPGLYWTWKVDGTRFAFAEGDAVNHTTTFGPREGLPESFYLDYQTASTTDNDSIRKAGYSIETGYLANCDIDAKSLYDKNNLVGSVKGYANYTHKYLITTEKTDGTGDEAPLKYHTGTKEKFHVYNDDPNCSETWEKTRDYTNDQTVVIPGTLNPDSVKWTQKWREIYGGAGYDSEGKYTSGEFEGYYVGPTASLRRDRYQEYTTYKSVQAYNASTVNAETQNLELEMDLTKIATGEIHIPRFLVMPMAAHAKSITFHLQTDKYSDDTTPTRSLRSADNIVFDHTSKNYGVGNTLMLPWMMRRQYCDYKFYLVDEGDNILDTRKGEGLIDDLTFENEKASNTHRLNSRDGDYSTFWTGGTDLSIKTTEGDEFVYNAEQNEYVVPQAWADKDVFILVKYKPSAEFEAMRSTGADAAKWVNIMNVENGNMMRYTRSGNVTGESRDSLNDVTNDYLWAIEGDPYGFKLHNRYADHGFNGTQNEKWSTLLTTDKVNTTEKFNYRSGVDDANANFTYDANGDPVIKSGITYGTKDTSDAFGTVSETTTNAVYEAMTGNYDKGMIIHPVNGCINVKDQNGYKYFGAFMFNGAPTGDPVQLNYMQDWEVMRNVYANWQFVKPAAKQFLPYYNRAGFVGGLKTDVAANADNKAIFEKIKNKEALSDSEYNTVWSLVQDPENLVALQDGGYYRLKPYSAGSGVVGGQYVSGYLHKLEKTAASPIHLYEQVNQSGNLTGLDNYSGNEWAAGFEQKIEVMDPEYDPSSIFRVSRENIGGKSYVTLETQGLAISDNGMADLETLGDNPTEEQVTAYNASATVASQRFELQDIGLAAFQMRTKANVSGENAENRYLSYNPKTMKYGLNATANELNISEGVYQGATVKTHDTKWVLEPVGTTTANAAGVEYQHPLKVKLSHMGSQDYFTSVCFPFDVTLPRGAYAYSCQGNVMSTGDEQVIDGQKYRQLNIVQIAGEDMETVSKDWEVKSNNQVIPAGVPALLYADGNALLDGGVVGGSGNTVIVPLILGGEFTTEGTTEQTASVLNSLKNSPLKYSYLTGELTNEEITGDELVFVFGKFNGKLGFMRNANLDYTGVKNNRFLLHNKIYYLYDPTPSGSSANFVTIGFGEGLQIPDPVVDGVEEVIAPADVKRYEHDAIYDLQGRRVPRITQPGIYIINGRKVAVKRVNMD